MSREVVVVSGVRTAIGTFGGSLKDIATTELAAQVVREALSRAVQNAVSTSREAEVASARGLMGDGSVTDLVVAVGRAELTLQTAVAVRDRVVAAYQEVMRMPI